MFKNVLPQEGVKLPRLEGFFLFFSLTKLINIALGKGRVKRNWQGEKKQVFG